MSREDPPPLLVDELRRVADHHEYVLSRPLSTLEVALAQDALERHIDAISDVVDSLFWDYSAHESSRFIIVAGLTTGARPRVERAICEMLSDIAPEAHESIRQSFDALPIDLP